KSFCYLGCIITMDGDTEENVSCKIKTASQAFALLKNIWSSNQLNRTIKLRTFNSNVKSILFYRCETWRLTNSIIHLLQVFVKNCLRRIF
ncbi:hypothetical protein EAG_11385, partial [Camponotus floridanus]